MFLWAGSDSFAKAGYDYLRGREISDEEIERWEIGFLPDACDFIDLFKSVLGQSSLEFWQQASVQSICAKHALLYPKRQTLRSYRDDGIVFPYRSLDGRVRNIFFRPITWSANSGRGKYVSLKGIRKRDLVFGLYSAVQAFGKIGIVVVTEGLFDLIAINRILGENRCAVVAPIGCQVSTDFLETLIGAGANRLIFCLDGDCSGIRSTLKTFVKIRQKLRESGISAGWLLLPPNTDADDTFREGLSIPSSELANVIEMQQTKTLDLLRGQTIHVVEKSDSDALRKALFRPIKLRAIRQLLNLSFANQAVTISVRQRLHLHIRHILRSCDPPGSKDQTLPIDLALELFGCESAATLVLAVYAATKLSQGTLEVGLRNASVELRCTERTLRRHIRSFPRDLCISIEIVASDLRFSYKSNSIYDLWHRHCLPQLTKYANAL